MRSALFPEGVDFLAGVGPVHQGDLGQAVGGECDVGRAGTAAKVAFGFITD